MVKVKDPLKEAVEADRSQLKEQVKHLVGSHGEQPDHCPVETGTVFRGDILSILDREEVSVKEAVQHVPPPPPKPFYYVVRVATADRTPRGVPSPTVGILAYSFHAASRSDAIKQMRKFLRDRGMSLARLISARRDNWKAASSDPFLQPRDLRRLYPRQYEEAHA